MRVAFPRSVNNELMTSASRFVSGFLWRLVPDRAVIGGTVVFGSNTSTSKQAAADIKAAEVLRAELIGKINLRLIGEAEV